MARKTSRRTAPRSRSRSGATKLRTRHPIVTKSGAARERGKAAFSWTIRRFNALTPAEKEDYFRVKHAIREVREGKSLSLAVRELKTTVKHARELFPADFFKAKGSRRWSVSKSDNHVNQLPTIGDKGIQVELVRGSRNASQWGRYWNDAHKAVRDNDPLILEKWRNKKIGDRSLVTDLNELIEMANAGALGIDDSSMWRS
jgi:hypothetical protein